MIRLIYLSSYFASLYSEVSRLDRTGQIGSLSLWTLHRPHTFPGMLPGAYFHTSYFPHLDIYETKVYYRYVDEIVALFNNDTSICNFFHVLNSQYKNLQFTLEESKQTLPFIDVEIEIKGSSFS